MEKVILDAVLNELLSTAIPTILGAGKIFYRGALRDTPLPYLCYNVDLSPVPGEQNFLLTGELLFDVWDYATVNDRTLRVMRILRDTFNDGMLEVDGATAVRFYFEGSQEAAVENNRSNRRSEDEHFFRREVSFAIRAWDVMAQQNQPVIATTMAYLNPNAERYFSRVVAPAQQPDGVAYVFQLPTPAAQIIYYTLNGVRYEDMGREGLDLVVLPTVPAAGVSLTVCYVAG